MRTELFFVPRKCVDAQFVCPLPKILGVQISKKFQHHTRFHDPFFAHLKSLKAPLNVQPIRGTLSLLAS